MDKQEKLLNTALILFVGSGFHATPTSKIAREAGVATGTLFHYFKNKEELILAVYRRAKVQMLDQILDGTDINTGSKKTLEKIYTNALKWKMSNPEISQYIRQFQASPFVALIHAKESRQLEAPLMNILEPAMKSDDIKNLELDLLFLLINNHLQTITEYMHGISLDETKRNKLISDSFELLWDMIKKTD